MKREPGAAAERDDRGEQVANDAEHPAAFLVAVVRRHLPRHSHRRRRIAPDGAGIARGWRPRRRWRVHFGCRFHAEAGAAKIADQFAGLSFAAAYWTLDLCALVAARAFGEGRAGLDQRGAVSFAEGFRVGVGFFAAGAPFHGVKKSSGASFDEIGAKCDTPISSSRSLRRQIFPSPRADRAWLRPARLLFAIHPSRQIFRYRRASTARAACSR